MASKVGFDFVSVGPVAVRAGEASEADICSAVSGTSAVELCSTFFASLATVETVNFISFHFISCDFILISFQCWVAWRVCGGANQHVF
jgi:hypothetical protein